MLIDIHNNIKEKLNYFKLNNKIPNIIFHGPSGSGKKTIVQNFINEIYEFDKSKIKSSVLWANCAHGKGIKFIRDELKFFAKTNVHTRGGDFFKSVLLLNADKLTVDAQSALRRCIEVFSHKTRFFIVVEEKSFLLKPILSRFCEIYVPEPKILNNTVNLYKYQNELLFCNTDYDAKREYWLIRFINKSEKKSIDDVFIIADKMYEKGYSAINLIYLIEKSLIKFKSINESKKYELLLTFNKIKKEIRNEKLSIIFILNFLFLSLDINLENISFM
jgi:DNA polymerase III delta prime subunit